MEYFIGFLIGIVAGFILGALVYRNNAKKAESALLDTVNELLRTKGKVK